MENLLIGKTVTDMKIAEDKKAILFITTEGELIVRADGDCCSSTWVENINTPPMGFPAKILTIENLDMPNKETKTEDCEVIAYYGCRITTDKGDIDIDYRNSSNGYYGGNLSFPGDDYFYGGVYSQNVSNNDWKDIVAA